jgi:hypothetical protein
MNKRNGINNKLLTGWLLLLLFILPHAVKTVHICRCVYFHNSNDERHSNHVHHNCNTCAICQFVLFPFTETNPNEFNFTIKIICSEPFVYTENVNISVVYNYRLRAPPRL